MIRPADKGGGLVILNKKDYETEMERLLKTPDTYKKLKGNPKGEYEKKTEGIYPKRGKKRNINKKRS